MFVQELGEVGVNIGLAASKLKDATTSCGQSGSGSECQGDITDINNDLTKATTTLGNLPTDCADHGSKCLPRIANLTDIVAKASKAATSAQTSCDKNEKTFCSLDLVDASLNIAAGVIASGEAIGDCHGSSKYLK